MTTRQYTLVSKDGGVEWRRVLAFLHDRGADRFAFNILYCGDKRAESDRIYERFATFEMPPQVLEDVIVFSPRRWEDRFREQECFRFDAETIETILREVNGDLLKVHERFAEAWPEDWRVYRDGQLILGTITHEGDAWLKLNDEDVNEAERLGILAWFRPDGA